MGNDCSRLCLAFFFGSVIMTKFRDTINVLSKMTHFELILPDFGVHLLDRPLLGFSEGKKYSNKVCNSLGPGDHG